MIKKILVLLLIIVAVPFCIVSYYFSFFCVINLKYFYEGRLVQKEFENNKNVLCIHEIGDKMDSDARWDIYFETELRNKFAMTNVEFKNGEIVFSRLFESNKDLELGREIYTNSKIVKEVLKEIDSY